MYCDHSSMSIENKKLCMKLTNNSSWPLGWPVCCLCHTQDNDFLKNTVHRHEPPVTAEPIRLLAEDEDMVVVDKPSSIPVHPCGRFRHNTVIFILGKEHQLKELHPLHRLDRLTSGVLMFAKTAAVSERIHEQVRDRQVSQTFISCRLLPGPKKVLCVRRWSLSSTWNGPSYLSSQVSYLQEG